MAPRRPRVSKRDTAALADVRAAAREYDDLQAQRDRARVARDFAIMAAYRRGISVRAIADAAGVHPSRVGQLVAAADRAVEANNLQPLRPKSKKTR